MDAFHYVNHNVQEFDSANTRGFRIAGELALPGGNYVVSAKLNAGVNVNSGYPPPAWPYAGGAAILSLGGSHDMAFVSAKPESGENNDNLALSVAAKTSGNRKVRLYYIASYPLRTFVSAIRITALKVDKLDITEVGTDYTDVPEDPDEMLLRAMLNPRWRVSDFLRRIPDDG